MVVDRWDAQNHVMALHCLRVARVALKWTRNHVMALHCLRVARVALKWTRRAQKIPSGATKVRVKTEPCCQTPLPP